MGTLEEISTARGISWFIRFTRSPKDRPRYEVGLKADLPTKAKAHRAPQAQKFREWFNTTRGAPIPKEHTFGDLVARYELEEMPKRYSTRKGYSKMHRLYIVPRWGALPISQVEAAEVRTWLRGLQRSSRTRGHLHGHMRVLFKFAMLWKWAPLGVNPMTLFSIEGATKRAKEPQIITSAAFWQILETQDDIMRRCMLIGAFLLGLRCSELFALQWSDFDHLERSVSISRAIVDAITGEVKTYASEAKLPLNDFIARAFLQLRQETLYKQPGDWVFASDRMLGRLPLRSGRLQQRMLIPAGHSVGLTFNLGWHTFRHSFKTLMDEAKVEGVIKRDMMRHSDIHTTEQVYGKNEFEKLRSASEAVLAVALRSKN